MNRANPPWKFRRGPEDRGEALAQAIVALSSLELGVGDTVWIGLIRAPSPLAKRPPLGIFPATGGDSIDWEAEADRRFGGSAARRREEDKG